MQDTLRRFKKKEGRDWSELPSKIACQLNDTHPTIAIPETMRLLVDIEGLNWDTAYSYVTQIFNYTNHTVLPEALEKWPAGLMEKLLPRHIQIINEINHRFLTEVSNKWGPGPHMQKFSIFEEGENKMVRMANLAVIASNKVNGVAEIHSDLVKKDLFPDFVRWFAENGKPDKFVNMTNGVTPRRWIYCCNRGLYDLFSEWLGNDEWMKRLDLLRGLENHFGDELLFKQYETVKAHCKSKLVKFIHIHIYLYI
eukprot:GHVR01140787.1.p1 GENE.GHVR01140787.1~~GHVR01140787.1.p1  ORF type:complete len:253 (+),score=50.08 GHVR01140787.1:226-984(+)